jgi:hypothetical protein
LSEEEKGEMRRIIDEGRVKGERYGERHQAFVGH